MICMGNKYRTYIKPETWDNKEEYWISNNGWGMCNTGWGQKMIELGYGQTIICSLGGIGCNVDHAFVKIRNLEKKLESYS